MRLQLLGEKFGITILQDIRIIDDLIKTFKIINEISNYGRHFFNISPCTGNLLSRQISKTESTKISKFGGWNFWNKLSYHIKNRNGVKNIKLDDFRNNDIEKN